MSDNLDEFFGATPAPEAAPAEPAPEPAPQPEPSAEPSEDEPADATEAEADPAPQPGQRQVPLAALEAERKQRQDYKVQSARFEEQAKAEKARADALNTEIAELRKSAAPKPPEPMPVAVPDPVENPSGYLQHMQQTLFNERLQMSEAMMNQMAPDVDTKAIATRFMAEAQKDPRLGQQLRQQPHPYAWAAEQIKRIDALAQIGNDPSAYAAKLEADIRAKIAAEQGAAGPVPVTAPVTPRQPVQLPVSLATARSAAPRGDAATGPPDFEDLFPKR